MFSRVRVARSFLFAHIQKFILIDSFPLQLVMMQKEILRLSTGGKFFAFIAFC